MMIMEGFLESVISYKGRQYWIDKEVFEKVKTLKLIKTIGVDEGLEVYNVSHVNSTPLEIAEMYLVMLSHINYVQERSLGIGSIYDIVEKPEEFNIYYIDDKFNKVDDTIALSYAIRILE